MAAVNAMATTLAVDDGITAVIAPSSADSRSHELAIFLAIIFLHAFISGFIRRSGHTLQEVSRPLPVLKDATGHETSSRVQPATSDDPLQKCSPTAAKLVQSILNQRPDPSGIPLHCEPKHAPSGALPQQLADGVRALRATLESRLSGWSPAVQAEAEAQLDDLTLARWVAAFPKGTDSAFEHAMEWRVANNVGALYAELHPAARTREGRTPRQAAVQAYGYAGIGGLTRAGTPFMVERLGAADFAGYGRHGEAFAQLMRDGYVAHLELMTRAVRAAAAGSGTFAMGLVVVDTKGVGASILFHLAMVKFAAKVGLANFPEGTDRVLVVNAPGIVARVFAAVSSILPQATRDKVQLVSEKDTRAALEALIEPAEIPSFLGGLRPESMMGMPEAKPLPRQELVRV